MNNTSVIGMRHRLISLSEEMENIKKFPIILLNLVLFVSLIGCSGKARSDGDIRNVSDSSKILGDADSISAFEPLAKFGRFSLDYEIGYPGSAPNEDVYHKETMMLKRYIDGIVADSSFIVGPYNHVLPKDSLLLITAGADTVRIDFTRALPESIDMRFAGILAGCERKEFSRHYALNDSARLTDFQINLGLMSNPPYWLRRFISRLIRDKVQDYFDNTEIRLQPFASDGPAGMMENYYREFVRSYRKVNAVKSGSGEPEYGVSTSYQTFIYPVWESGDKSLITLRVYSFYYNGGAHGGETDYYATFDKRSGRRLNWKDFYSESEFNAALETLEEKLQDYMVYWHGWSEKDRSKIGPMLLIENQAEVERALEMKDYDKLYPIPALTSNGMVWSYPTYSKGGAADGVMHFTTPYSKAL